MRGNGHDRSDDARLKLSRCALQLFVQRGYAATSVRDIVGAAGLTNPVLYYHFGNKEGLFLSIIEDAMHSFFTVLEKASEMETDLTSDIERVLNAFFDYTEKNPDLVRLAYIIVFSAPGSHPLVDVKGFVEREITILQGLAKRLIATCDKYSAMNEEIVCRMLRGIINIHILCRFSGEIEKLDNNLAKVLARYLTHGLTPAIQDSEEER